MEGISLIRYSPNNGNHQLTERLVECYRDVFADGPWHEWLKCSRCQRYWGVKDRELLVSYKFLHCATPLVDFWPREQVVSDIHHEITSEASCWLAMDNDVAVGFCWGYPIALPDLEIKLGVSLGTDLKHHPEISGRIAYQDEVGVLPSYRKRGIAKEMVILRLNDFLAQGLRIGIVRTRQSPEPSETFLWYTGKLGYKILANYPGNDGRVILGRPLSGLKELLTT